MNRTPNRIELCDECRFDGGQHFTVDLDGRTTVTRPHHDAAKVKEQAQRIVELAHEEQTKQARDIVRAAAETMLEFSANQIRHQMFDAGIEGPVIAAAFTWAADVADPPLIEATGRGVQSSDPATRHRINIWRSKIHRFADREAS